MKALGYTKDQAPGTISPYLPDFVANDITDVDFVRLKNMGVTHLMLDLDGTLRKAYARKLESEVIEVFRELQDQKLFKVIAIASNNNFRLHRFAKPIGARVFQPYWHNTRLIRKPHPLFFSHVMNELGIKPSQAVMIGDRLRSDIVGANKAGIRTVLIKQRGSGYWFDHILLSSFRERRHYERALNARRLHTPSTLHYLRDALESSGLPCTHIEHVATDAASSTTFVASNRSQRYFVKLVNRQHTFTNKIGTFLRKLTRRRNNSKYRSPAEALGNEARVLAQASASGVSVPEVHQLIDMDDGRYALVLEHVKGTRLNRLPSKKVTDPLLHKVWRQIITMHHAAIAHGDLRTANVMVTNDRVQIIGFDNADDNPTPQKILLDNLQFIISTAQLVGTERAIKIAHKHISLADYVPLMRAPITIALSTAEKRKVEREIKKYL